MALYGLVKILKLRVGSGRLCVGPRRLSGWVCLKSVWWEGGWVGQVGKLARWLGSSGDLGK